MLFEYGWNELQADVITTETASLSLDSFCYALFNFTVDLFLDWIPAGMRMGDERRIIYETSALTPRDVTVAVGLVSF